MNAAKELFKRAIASILKFEAKLILKKYNPKIVAVTGNLGKTSTKDAIFSVLQNWRYVRKSEKSFNSEIGIPLTIIGSHNPWTNVFLWMGVMAKGLSVILFKKKYPVWLILEVGADRPGDIEQIASWLSPNIVVVTRFAQVPVHVEYFKTRDALIEEKKHLVRALRKDGLLVLNKDDKDSYSMREAFDGQVVTYGFTDGASVQADYCKLLFDEKNERPKGVSFKIAYDNYTIPVKMHGTIGVGQAYSALPALVIGAASNIKMEEILDALARHKVPPGRMRILDGVKNTFIIDDSYNSSPAAAENALDALEKIKAKGRKIVAFGDMLELGKYSANEHKRIGKRIAEVADMLATVGIRARAVAEGALRGGMSEKVITQFDDAQKAGKYIELELKEGDAVLVKGSQSIRMERVVEEIMAEPDKKKELLVRQESQWLVK